MAGKFEVHMVLVGVNRNSPTPIMDIDDSYFEPEEQDCNSSDSDKIKEKGSYCARRCELGWFLEESLSTTFDSENAPISSGSDIGICEKPKEQAQGVDFMLLKYRADLCYSLKDFRSAAALFEQVLKLLPPLNAMVKREVTDSLARCYSHLSEHWLAEERAKQMILPPYDGDASSWKLLSQCQKSAGDYEAYLTSLQKCVATERQHADFWIALAEGYRFLRMTYTDVLLPNSSTGGVPLGDIGANTERLKITDQLGDILSNTVSLFRPYFSWRDIVTRPDATKMNQLLITGSKVLLTSDVSKQDCKPNLATAHENTTKMNHLDLDQSVYQCHKNCPFFTHSQSSTESSYYFYPSVIGELGTRSISLCLLHSPFVILASRQSTVEEFIELLKSIEKSRSIELLCSFHTMAECSCYIWARQLLIYSARYSSSFAKVAMTAKLEQLEEKLTTSDQDIRTFLRHHFSQKTIFENASSNSS